MREERSLGIRDVVHHLMARLQGWREVKPGDIVRKETIEVVKGELKALIVQLEAARRGELVLQKPKRRGS